MMIYLMHWILLDLGIRVGFDDHFRVVKQLGRTSTESGMLKLRPHAWRTHLP